MGSALHSQELIHSKGNRRRGVPSFLIRYQGLGLPSKEEKEENKTPTPPDLIGARGEVLA